LALDQRNRGDHDAVDRTVFRGDMEESVMWDTAAFDRLVVEGCTWVNVAYLNLPSEMDQISVTASLLEAAGISESDASCIASPRSSLDALASMSSPKTLNGSLATGTKRPGSRRAISVQRSRDSLDVAILRLPAVFGRRATLPYYYSELLRESHELHSECRRTLS
jgi:hypothetical protein